ncbi:MAG: FmdB family transcriptional regulator, partial [Verrucomicrobia bacterium A1]
MPIYEYGCAKCGRVSGFLVRNMAAHTTPACPHCGSRRMSRAVSRVAI